MFFSCCYFFFTSKNRGYVGVVYNQKFDDVLPEYVSSTVPKQLSNFEKLLEMNKSNLSGGELYFVGNKFNCADLMVFDMLELIIRLDAHALDKFPLLKKHHAQIAARPNISKYLESGKRPAKINNSGKG